jgi:predicted DCC family thiol-disulfide oxidoreductase YuxK
MSAHSGRLAELVLYDGACAFCTRWVRFWQPTLARHSFGVSTLQAAHADGTISIPQEHLLDDIRVRNSAGELIGGADAY